MQIQTRAMDEFLMFYEIFKPYTVRVSKFGILALRKRACERAQAAYLINIERLAIVQSRGISLCQKLNFEGAAGINSSLQNF